MISTPNSLWNFGLKNKLDMEPATSDAISSIRRIIS
jgi:hypothetical protein